MRSPARFVSELPSVLRVGGVQDNVAAPTDGAGVVGFGATVIENAGNFVVALPSLTLMTMFEWVAAADGVPLKRPVVVLKEAQLGLFWIAKPNVSPLASFAVGWKL